MSLFPEKFERPLQKLQIDEFDGKHGMAEPAHLLFDDP